MLKHKTSRLFAFIALAAAGGIVSCSVSDIFAQKPVDYHDFSKTPAMGWNSWDCFGTTITDEIARAQIDAQVKYLKDFGWNYFVVDIQWYEPNSSGHGYRNGAVLQMDEYGRLLPALTKFPSAKDGAGFKPLADYAHKKGLKFGIHMMRGIPKQAVRQNTPVKGTNVRAADIADQRNTCAWNPDMFGVDMRKPGAQAYYDSLFELYASWGVDYIKIDDISRPYSDFQLREIEGIRQSIDKCGRPIVLSLSPGETPLSRGNHVNQFANSWRVSDDFWDNWNSLYAQFRRLHNWTPYRKTGAWPDGDMLPFGIISFNKPTKFTKDEQVTCMSLWCIARSPLMLGADMTKMDQWTVDLLTNREVLAVNQASDNNRQLKNDKGLIVWVADVPKSQDKYVGFFNINNPGSVDVDISQAVYSSMLVGGGAGGVEKAEIKADIKGTKKLGLFVSTGDDDSNYDHAGWIHPTLSGPNGTMDLTKIRWQSARQGWGNTRVGRTSDNAPIEGIGTHAESLIVWNNLPEGYDTFTATGELVDNSASRGGSVRFYVITDKGFGRAMPDASEVSVKFEELGLSGKVKVRDLWQKKDLGTFDGSFSQSIKCHAAGLYRFTPVK